MNLLDMFVATGEMKKNLYKPVKYCVILGEV